MTTRVWLKGGFGNTLFQITHALAIYTATKNEVIIISNLTEKNVITIALKWTIHDSLFKGFINKSNFPIRIQKTSINESILITLKAFLSRFLNMKFYGTLYSNTSDINVIQNNSINHFGYYQMSDCNTYYLQAFQKVTNELFEQFYSESEHRIVVHFRWGDSDQAKKTIGYYETVRKMLLGLDDCVIVTDSVNVAKDFFGKLNNCKIIKGDALADFSLLISADILFCAYSTFSWWAGQSSKGRVIYMPSEFEEFTFINRSKFIYLS